MTIPSYRVIAKQKYESNIRYDFNPAKTVVLCIKQAKSSAKHVYPPLAFFIYDLKNSKVLFEDALPNGEVKWVNNTQIAVHTIPGIVRVDAKGGTESGYIYDIKSAKKIKKNAVELK